MESGACETDVITSNKMYSGILIPQSLLHSVHSYVCSFNTKIKVLAIQISKGKPPIYGMPSYLIKLYIQNA